MPGTYARLPCGCDLWNQVHDGGKVFVMRPCSPRCEYYRYATAESGRRGVPVEHRLDVP